MPVSPPKPKPLPLTALRAFEAAARLGGFAAAAQELGVSAGAVSAHIKALEEALDAPLFRRGAKGVELSPLGARTAADFTAAFDQLGQAVQTLRAEAAPRVVRIAALPAVAQLWLSPRLPALRAEAPELEISITAMEEVPNLKRMPFDLCLFYGMDRGETVAGDVIFPVCAPELAARLSRPEDLQSVPCISDSAWRDDWTAWLAAAGPGAGLPLRGPEFSLFSLAVEECLNGAGVLIGHEALIARYLADGRLVAPFSARVDTARPLRMWSPRPLRPNTPAGRVAAWLRGSAPQP